MKEAGWGVFCGPQGCALGDTCTMRTTHSFKLFAGATRRCVYCGAGVRTPIPV